MRTERLRVLRTSDALRELISAMLLAWAPYGGLDSTNEVDRPYAEAIRLVRELAEQKQREGD